MIEIFHFNLDFLYQKKSLKKKKDLKIKSKFKTKKVYVIYKKQ